MHILSLAHMPVNIITVTNIEQYNMDKIDIFDIWQFAFTSRGYETAIFHIGTLCIGIEKLQSRWLVVDWSILDEK